METFRTLLKIGPAPFHITHLDHLMLVGSCFTGHIGDRLRAARFSVLTNPFGIVYHPFAITRCLERLWAGNHFFSEREIFENAGLWHSWEHHGIFSKPDQQDTLSGLNDAYARSAGFLKKTSRLLLTFGTADVFALRETGQIVANNHKMPAAHFEERRLCVSEIVDGAVGILQKIKSAKVDLQVVLTVSPVRHLRNGAVANQRSKATLVLACEEIGRQLDFVHYFPAYEMLLDDLRDYRFYAADMIHPSEVAVQYIWDAFVATYFSATTKTISERIGKIATAAQHRPFHPGTPEYRAFAQAQLNAIESLKKECPGLDLEEEQAYFRQFIPV